MEDLEKKKFDVETRLSEYPRAALQQAATLLQTIQSSIQHIRYLISDYAHNKIKVKSLLEEEETIKNLYDIFSKELLLLVLSESLPLLADIINVFLAQVVQFQLALRVVGEDDKLELEAIISDEQGEREVKSLSGGQRVILKLVWMLALSSFMRSPLLFLDETINNLDKDTVGVVADMLADFIKKNDIKLYTITHSEQIQAMGIWDGIIKL
jgi:DNA repair exonuclease SbcCD ATPase subunit